MDLRLRPELAARYTSASQRARVVTEDWAERQLYCPACPANHLRRYRNNRAVSDFTCGRCGADFQLKGKQGAFRPTVSNSAYAKKIEAIRSGTVPNYVFLSYDADLTEVLSGFAVPGHFITPSVVQKRNPLGETAKRKGWVGSNLRIGALAPDARVWLAEQSKPRKVGAVRREWARFRFLEERGATERGWIADVLAAVREIGRSRFRLEEVYAFEARLGRLHPENRHVKPKIRQQLQQLRNRGIVRFLGSGEYRIT